MKTFGYYFVVSLLLFLSFNLYGQLSHTVDFLDGGENITDYRRG